jgi:hypothetical protein
MTTAPTLDGSVSAAATGSFSTASLSTTKTNDIIVFVVYNEQATQQTVSSITSSGCNLALYGAFTGVDPARPGRYVSLEIWWGFSSAILTSHVFTIAMSGTFDDGGYVGFGVNGVANTSSPWDSSASFPAHGTGGTLTFSTIQAHDLLISAFASSTNNTPASNANVHGTSSQYDSGSYPVAWTQLANTSTAGGSQWAFMSVYTGATSATIAGLTVGPPATMLNPAADLAFVGGALTADVVVAASGQSFMNFGPI